MAFDVALTIGIDASGAKQGADQAVNALERISTAANGRYGSIGQEGSGAWKAIADAAELSAQRQVSAADRTASSLSEASRSASGTILGVLGFSPSDDIATAESNISFLRRLLDERRPRDSADFLRAQNLGVASPFGLSIDRITAALTFQEEALRILLRRRELEGRAVGGPVTAGKPFVVGENGPEVFVPQSSGRIIPNGSGGGNAVNITVNGADNPEVVAQKVIAHINFQAALGNPTLNTASQRARNKRGG